MTDLPEIDVDEVMANVRNSYAHRRQHWDHSEGVWPNATVYAMAEEITRLRAEVAKGQCSGGGPCVITQHVEMLVEMRREKCGALQREPKDTPGRPPSPPSPRCNLDPGHDGLHEGRTMHRFVRWR